MQSLAAYTDVVGEVREHLASRLAAAGSDSTRERRSKIIVVRSSVVYVGQSSPGTPVRLNDRHRRWTSRLTVRAERRSPATVSRFP